MAAQSHRLTSDDAQALRELGWSLSNNRAKRFTPARKLILPIDPDSAEVLLEDGSVVQLDDAR